MFNIMLMTSCEHIVARKHKVHFIPLPDNKISARSELRGFAVDKFKMADMAEFVLERVKEYQSI